ncbi:unnamed protein product [Gulo gulo]|uniref:Uncharacterized protein n=1 Tax=Gulo gulo TaxID=48420 RepID=A0A9X9LK83_GULGU|nr:unnamed protein product [Gulo gulo]
MVIEVFLSYSNFRKNTIEKPNIRSTLEGKSYLF